MAFSMALSIINKICNPQTMNAILANLSVINYSINTRHMTSNGLISLTRLLHHLCINICVFTYLKDACSCVHPLNDNSVGASNVMAGNRKLE